MCMFCRSLFVFSEVRVTRSLVLCVCFVKKKQRSTKHTHKTKDLVTRTSLKTNNDLQNITHKTKDQVTRTSLKTNNDLQNIHIKLKIK
jgi:hypothetical protein